MMMMMAWVGGVEGYVYFCEVGIFKEDEEDEDKFGGRIFSKI